MDKYTTLESIINAKKIHEVQMTKIKASINGVIVKAPTQTSKEKCAFGNWLYDEQYHLREILGSMFYDKIETLHARWHIEYLKIFEIFFKERKKGFFNKMLGTSKVSTMELDKAKMYYFELEATSKELFKALESSQRRIAALAESKFY
ncbi:MAG: hypothetical protein ACJAWW_000385 [Sulfurimonas sp.]|jgi:hypothetical protein